MGLTRPTFCHIPEYVKTHGGEVADQCDEIGYAPDPQQRLGLDAIFGRRADGLSAAFEMGVVAGRQNIKSGLFKQAMIGWLFLFDEQLIIYSAHKFFSAMEIFRDMEKLIGGSSSLSRRVKRVIRNHGEESIELMTGARVMFVTRTPDSGRSLSAYKVILDEAYALTDGHMGGLLPTLSAKPDPQIFYGSSAGKATSETLRGVRDRGREGLSPRLAWLEWCAPGPDITCDAGMRCTHAKTAVGCGCDKPDYWLQANPAIGDRMTLEYVTAERQALPVDEFCRERMGWWDDPQGGASPMSLLKWMQCADEHSTPGPGSPLALGIAMAPDGSMSALSVAGWREDGLPHGELAEHLPGTGWMLDRVLGITERRDPCAVVLDPAGPAGALEKPLRMHGFVTVPKDGEVVKLKPGQHLLMVCSAREYAQACGMVTNAVMETEMRHPDQKPLNDAVQASRSRPVAQAWAWASSEGKDITPLEAFTLAHLGLATYGTKRGLVPFAFSS